MKKFTLLFFNAIIIGLIALVAACTSSKAPDLGLIPVKSADKWQYIDKDGKIIINPQFSYAAGFFEGLALVRNTADPQRYGFINDQGVMAINANYVSATSFSEGLACVVQENGSPTYIDSKGQIKFTLKDAQIATFFSEGYAAFSQFDKDGNSIWGYVDKTGAVKIVPQFYSASIFSEGMAAIMDKDSKWGFIDAKGQIVINYQFKSAGDFKDGLCIVSDGKNFGYIDKTGKYAINPQYDAAFQFAEGLARVKMNGGKYGYIDKTGKIIINPQFDDAIGFSGGRAAVANAGKWGYIDKDGKFIINTQFDYASYFFGKIAFIEANGKIGVIDKDGKYIINPQYDGINRDVLLGTVTDRSVETDYFDASMILSYINPYAELLKSNTTVGQIVEKLKTVRSVIGYNNITVDSTLGNKSNVHFEYVSNVSIQSNDYYQSKMLNTNAPINQFNYSVALTKPKAKVLFESLKSQISSLNSVVLIKEKSNDNQCVFESGNQMWGIFLRSDRNISVNILIKTANEVIGD